MTARILYVEDQHDLRGLVTEFLEDAGLDVVPLATAEGALLALQGEQPFDLLLTDYRLPSRNADWLISEVCTQGLIARERILVVTAEPELEGIGQDIPVLYKPVDIDRLLNALALALRGGELSGSSWEPASIARVA